MDGFLENPLRVAGLMLAVALATIAGAWGFELIGGYVPCKLCLQERIPYYVGIPVIALAAVSAIRTGPSTATKGLLALAGLVFLVGFFMGGYHAGVEYGWFEGPSDCGAGGDGASFSAAELLTQLENIRIVSCSEATWRFPEGWGLSFAGWNAVISADLAAGGFLGAWFAGRGSAA